MANLAMEPAIPFLELDSGNAIDDMSEEKDSITPQEEHPQKELSSLQSTAMVVSFATQLTIILSVAGVKPFAYLRSGKALSVIFFVFTFNGSDISRVTRSV